MTQQKSNEAVTWILATVYIGLLVGMIWCYNNVTNDKKQEKEIKIEQKQIQKQIQKQGKQTKKEEDYIEEEYSFVKTNNKKLLAMNYQR